MAIMKLSICYGKKTKKYEVKQSETYNQIYIKSTVVYWSGQSVAEEDDLGLGLD